MYGIGEIERSAVVADKYSSAVGLQACLVNLVSESREGAARAGWEEIKERWQGKTPADLSGDATLRAYREFLNEAGASENLLRRFLFEGGGRSINLVVDDVNLVSMKSKVALAAFDATQINGEMFLDLTTQEEQLKSIGGKVIRIPAGELVLRDAKRLISWVGRRDGEATKVEAGAKVVWLVGVRVKGVDETQVSQALLQAVHELSGDFIIRLDDSKVDNEVAANFP